MYRTFGKSLSRQIPYRFIARQRVAFSRWFSSVAFLLVLALQFHATSVSAAPAIDSFDPPQGGEGKVITIIGRGFGNNPDNVCAIVMNGDLAIPLQVQSASDTQIKAMLGPVTPDARPGPIMIALGTGNKGFFKPAFPDMNVREPVWVWVRTPNGPEAGSQQPFTPIPPPAPTTNWFFSGPPSNGVICLYINANWPSPAKIRVQARAHDHEKGIGRDLEAYCIEFPAGGSILDCASRICDTIRCAFMQQGMVSVNCKVEQVPGANLVKLTLSMPDGHIGWGNLNVCVEPAQPPPTPVITDFTPTQGQEGDLITIKGTGFGNNPDNLCMVIMMPDNRSVPLEVLTANGGEATARLGAVPMDAQPGPIMLGLGDGNRGTFRPAFFDIFVADDVWTWNKTGPATMSQPPLVPFQPIPNPQPNPTTNWFFSGPPTTAGEICVIIDKPWPAKAKVRIEARAHDHQQGIGRDLRAICIEFGSATITSPAGTIVDPPSALKCAYRICDVIVCAFRQQAGLDINCTVTDLGDGMVKITLSLPDGRIGWGNLNICVQPVPEPPAPTIASVEPTEGRPGDVITIRGTGFGNCPDNLCVVVMNGGISIPMQAIKASDTEIQAMLGEVYPGAVPGKIMVGLGHGNFGRFRPAFFDIFVADDVWTWNRTGGAAMSAAPFTPMPRSPGVVGDAPQWFFSGPPTTDGKICLILNSPWPRPAKVQVQGRAHDHARGIGRDLAAYQLIFEGGGSLFECALRICDTIRCAFFQQAGIDVNCTVEQLDGTVKITLSLPEGHISWGNLNVCVEKCPEDPAPIVTGVTPAQGGEGTLVTITGTGFGNNPDNVCAVVMSGNESVPMEVVEASDTQAKAILGAVRLGAQPGPIMPGPIMIGLGAGAHGRFTPALSNIVVRKPVWVWNRNGGPAGTGGTFTPQANQPNTTNVWFFSGPPVNGMLMTVIQGNWPANALLRIEARAHDHARRVGHDLRAICIQFPAGGTLQQCATQICDVVRCAFLQQAGIIVNCQIVQLSPTQIKLVLTLPNGTIDWGNFNICVSAAPPDPVITSIMPLFAREGDIVTVRGTNFPTDPNDVCMVHMGPAGPTGEQMSTPFQVLTSTPTQIVARLGVVNPEAKPGTIMIGLGEGQMGQPKFAFFDVFAELPVWTWNRTGPAVQFTPPPPMLFRPISTPAPPTTNWFFSGPPVNGKLCLTLTGNWPSPAKIRIEARAHDHQKMIGRDLQALCIRFEGGGNLIDCAKRICDVIRCAFMQQGGFNVNCSIEPNFDATGALVSVKLTLSLPEGHVDWGNFNVCVSPSPTPPPPVIDVVTPLTGGEGTIVRIKGTGFGNNPQNLCAVIMSGNESIPLTVLETTPDEVVARLGPVRPRAASGPIMIGLGEGQRGTFRPAFFDIFVEEPVWTWRKTGGAAMSEEIFTPTGTQPPPQTEWFFSGPPTPEGEICLFLTGNWPPGSKLRIQARAHDHQRGIGRDLEAFCIRFPNGGTLLDCAKRICDVIRCAFFQQAGLAVNCTVTTLAGGVVKLTLSLPDGHIDWGNFNVCVDSQPPPPGPITITGFDPVEGGEDKVITIHGTGFGNNPNNICAVVMNGACSIPMEVLTATDTNLTARLGAVPPDAERGMIMVGLGQGNMGRFRPAFFDVFVADDVWTWNRAGGPATMSAAFFTPLPQPEPPYTRWFFGEKPANGVICLYLTGNWPDPAKVRIEARLHDHNSGIGHDLRAVCVEWGSFSFVGPDGTVQVAPMDLLGCALRICDTIACAFFQQAGIQVNCEIFPIDDDTVKMVLSLPNGRVTWGNFNVCVAPVDGDPGPELVIVRDPPAGALPTVTLCWPLTRTGYCLQARDALRASFPWQLMAAPLRVEGIQVKVTVPIDQPQQYFRLYRQPALLTNPD